MVTVYGKENLPRDVQTGAASRDIPREVFLPVYRNHKVFLLSSINIKQKNVFVVVFIPKITKILELL